MVYIIWLAIFVIGVVIDAKTIPETIGTLTQVHYIWGVIIGSLGTTFYDIFITKSKDK